MEQQDIQKLVETLGNAHINVNGDLVISKVVEYEVNNVEPGGIGIQIVNGDKVHTDNNVSPVTSDPVPPNSNVSDMADSEDKKQEGDIKTDAPIIPLQQLLKEPWFADFRTQKRFDSDWTDKFVNDLMSSSLRESIVKDWALNGKNDQKTKIKAHLVGSLLEAGVLDGKCLTIAKARLYKKYNDKDGDRSKAEFNTKSRTFANYMGHCNRAIFYDWIIEYVNNN